jgi:hypothetical protein
MEFETIGSFAILSRGNQEDPRAPGADVACRPVFYRTNTFSRERPFNKFSLKRLRFSNPKIIPKYLMAQRRHGPN